jgi:predicted O-linked N-acetylglucosamine transferase (SPINDLY family)
MALQAAGQLDQALATVRMHLKFKPRDPAGLNLLGVLLRYAGQMPQSIDALQRAVALAPNETGIRNNLANSLSAARRFAEATAQWEQAVRIDPRFDIGWMCLAVAYTHVNRMEDAIAAGRRGLSLQPDLPEAAANLAFSLQQACRIDEAVAVAEPAVRRSPSAELLRSNLLLMLNYGSSDPARVAQAHRAFGSAFPSPEPPPLRSEDREHPLRVGVLSADLCDHSVAFFAEAIMAHRPADTTVVAVHTAAPQPQEPTQQRLRRLATEWIEANALPDEVLDAKLRDAHLDVLIELSGHSAGGRLAALARKPAPVMITAIGYPNTTGLPAMDFRVVDSITDPPGSEHFCTERLLRLDPCFLCYTPPQQAPEPAMPAGDAPITFGSFNNANKISRQTAELWGGLMRAVPNARLLLKARSMGDASVRETILARLEAGGVPSDRVDVVAYAAGRDGHLATYHRVHVALDTVPYNGTTTTCEALWMGVPVIATLGDRHAARVSASLLHAVGHPEWVAKDAADFARLGAALAADRAALGGLRGSLRGQMAASTLCDARAYGERFHAAIRACWANACKDSTNV